MSGLLLALALVPLGAASAQVSVHSASVMSAGAVTLRATPHATINAIGYGADTVGGSGRHLTPPATTIYHVTNLNNAGSGSLREALTAAGARIIIFDLSGTIALATKINILNPYVTIAGQSAPSPGITLKDSGLSIKTHDVLIQHLRVRPGDGPVGQSPSSRDGIDIIGDAYNVVIDHASVSWAVDENMSTWEDDGIRPRDITISNSILSEGLHRSIHPEGPHSKGLLAGFGTKRLSVIRSLLAHNYDRHPEVQSGVEIAWVNNIIYDWVVRRATSLSGSSPWKAVLLGNKYIRGLSPDIFPPDAPAVIGIGVRTGAVVGSELYMDDNEIVGVPTELYRNEASFDPIVPSPPIALPSLLTVLPIGQVETHLLLNVGARPRDRDVVDARVIEQVENGTGQIIDSQADVGGWPTLAVNTIDHTAEPGWPAANLHGINRATGYTYLEGYLEALAEQVE